MLAITKREKEGYLDTRSINNFPCEDLCTINNLWTHYSDGRFGFSVQKKIYQRLGGTKKYDDKIWQSFGDTVGWRKEGKSLYYKNITFDKTTTKEHPTGHLPVAFGYEGGVVSLRFRRFGRWTGVGGSLLSPQCLYIVRALRKIFPGLSNQLT
jgi:hypothetical protein